MNQNYVRIDQIICELTKKDKIVEISGKLEPIINTDLLFL